MMTDKLTVSSIQAAGSLSASSLESRTTQLSYDAHAQREARFKSVCSSEQPRKRREIVRILSRPKDAIVVE